MTHGLAARDVLIPMVGGPSGGTLARISADAELAASHSAQLDRALTELLESGLYQAGQQALAAVRLLKMSRWRGLQRSVAAFHVVNPGEVVGLGMENANSAELGLALVLSMFRAQSKERCVLASGELDLNTGDHGIAVRPVHHLARKLRLAIEYFIQPGSAKAPTYFFVPVHDPDGADVLDRYRQEAQELRELGVSLRPVVTLAEAARILGARREATGLSERMVRRVLATAAISTVIAVGVKAWLAAPIDLSFTSVANADGSITVTPARSQSKASGGAPLLSPCRIDTVMPGFAFGENVAVRLRTGSRNDFARWTGGYHHLLIGVSELSGVKVLSPPRSGWVTPGEETGYLLPVKAPEEETLLAWLAKRGGAFDPQATQAWLQAALNPLQPTERIAAARNLLERAAPGALFYSFRSVPLGACSGAAE